MIVYIVKRAIYKSIWVELNWIVLSGLTSLNLCPTSMVSFWLFSLSGQRYFQWSIKVWLLSIFCPPLPSQDLSSLSISVFNSQTFPIYVHLFVFATASGEGRSRFFSHFSNDPFKVVWRCRPLNSFCSSRWDVGVQKAKWWEVEYVWRKPPVFSRRPSSVATLHQIACISDTGNTHILADAHVSSQTTQINVRCSSAVVTSLFQNKNDA